LSPFPVGRRKDVGDRPASKMSIRGRRVRRAYVMLDQTNHERSER
jgi:hypothetical protein